MTHKMQSSQRTTPFFLYITLWFLVWLHVLRGVMTLLVLFPFLNANSKKQHIQRWSKRLLKIFGIQLQVNNADALTDSSYLLAANHVSWMDIHAINAFKPIRFVAKSEVEQWPIFGWMAKQLGTVFINRESSRHARQVVTDMAVLLKTQSICIFPEGTSTIGKSVQTFKPNLFEAAILAHVPVLPIAIAYRSRSTGLRSNAPAFIGDMGLLESMSNVIASRDIEVHLSLAEPYLTGKAENADRKELALYCQEAITKTL